MYKCFSRRGEAGKWAGTWMEYPPPPHPNSRPDAILQLLLCFCAPSSACTRCPTSTAWVQVTSPAPLHSLASGLLLLQLPLHPIALQPTVMQSKMQLIPPTSVLHTHTHTHHTDFLPVSQRTEKSVNKIYNYIICWGAINRT